MGGRTRGVGATLGGVSGSERARALVEASAELVSKARARRIAGAIQTRTIPSRFRFSSRPERAIIGPGRPLNDATAAVRDPTTQRMVSGRRPLAERVGQAPRNSP